MKFKLENIDENKVIKYGLLIFILVLLIYSTLLYFSFDDWNNRGTFGDSWGMVSSLFSGVAVLLLILTLIIQKKEYKITQDEFKLSRQAQEQSSDALAMQAKTLKIQQFENTFFKLLEQHMILFDNCNNNIAGGQKYSYNIFETEHIFDFYPILSWDIKECIAKLNGDDGKSYNKFLGKYARGLFPYLRNIESILSLLEATKGLKIPFYLRLFQSQLSIGEIGNLKYYYHTNDERNNLRRLLKGVYTRLLIDINVTHIK